MNDTIKPTTEAVITGEELLNHWQGHRRLTRRVIEAFPEEDFFTFSIGGMRPLSGLVSELLAIAGPGLREMAENKTEALNEQLKEATSKESFLKLWDAATADIDRYWALIPEERFHDKVMTFGQYEGTVWSSIFYFIDNEIHHRAQATVYLRALGIEPPFFWER
jgi:uncharacterized damage-inducible protein DinB